MAVGKIYLRAFDFETIENYFEYILESEINGQRLQVQNLIDKMSKQQKKDCLAWFEEQPKTNDLEICKKLLTQAI